MSGHIQTYEGIDRYKLLVTSCDEEAGETVETELWVTESTHRPSGFRWEASDRDGSPSIFASTIESLLDEIDADGMVQTIEVTEHLS